jgi:ATP-binding cassette subfamily B protein/subfamily B ATP-binding cassette protein MsbA
MTSLAPSLLKYTRPYRRDFLWVGLLMLIGIALSVLTPWPLKLIVDYVIPGKPLPPFADFLSQLPDAGSGSVILAWLAGATLILFAGNQFVSVLRAYIQTGAAARMKFDLGASVFNHLQEMSLRFHNRQRTGDLIRRVTSDSECIRQLVMQIIIPGLKAIVTLLVMFVIMWQFDHVLALTALLVLIPLPYLIRRMAPVMTERSYEHEQSQSELIVVAERTMSSLPIVQAFGREPDQNRLFTSASWQTIRTYMRTVASQLYYKIGVSSATTVGTALVMVLGAFKVIDGSISVGDLLVILSYLGSVYQPIEVLAYLPMTYADTESRARRVLEILASEEEIVDSPEAREMPVTKAMRGVSVRLDNVSFGYEPGRPVLKNVTLDARPGETIALIGATGEGKTTLVSLIPRFFDPWSGCVFINDTDVRNIKLDSLRSQIALVFQDPFLLPLSIAENIAYGRPGATHEEIIAAAKAANADEFIRRQPEGYSTIIGERGATLSGGQRQRLSLARAFVKDAPILILDEPTSALDAHTEALLIEALERLTAGRTTFIIAHRMSTIRNADRVFELRDGSLAECNEKFAVEPTGPQKGKNVGP